jgi:hypothetical protein
LAKLKIKVQENFNIPLSQSSISNAIENFDKSLKKGVLVPAARNTPENKVKRFGYAYDFTKYHMKA